MRMIPFAPSERLRPFVRAITLVETSDASTSAPVPEPGLLLGIRFSGTAALCEGNVASRLPDSGLTGIRSTVHRIHTSARGGIVVVAFQTAVGASPKQFASILRFRRVVAGHGSGATLTALAHEAGYFDQSYLIRDVRSFTGEPPERFLSGVYC